MAPVFTGRPTSCAAEAVLHFWFTKTKPYQWFRTDRVFDCAVAEQFGALHAAACSGQLDVWHAHPRHVLALIIILDQFSRNIFRGTPRAFAQDELAASVAVAAIAKRFDMIAPPKQRAFFYIPLMHSEALGVQEQSVAFYKARLAATHNLAHAIEHRNIIARFGRFPHRNKILGRKSSPEEIAFLKAGGFNP